eukprot:CAMPEP_0175118598 /NCGR_PEP_ID=MMETSP0086_2-20121207/19649_1 /TAXON_ID=136419 /ORGANISM="Unknown Unknown, Strain D1" /LENGTH=60 /DNA_ID=CAMNT_0016399673 /DNA_START=1 /DNA_END=180 /DNA_ORIENTATION=-
MNTTLIFCACAAIFSAAVTMCLPHETQGKQLVDVVQRKSSAATKAGFDNLLKSPKPGPVA